MRCLNKTTWPFQASCLNENQNEVKAWCDKSIGKMHIDWFSYDHNQYVFRSAEDLLLFKIRWRTLQ